MKFKRGQDIELKFIGTRYNKYKVVKDFDSKDKAMTLWDIKERQEIKVLINKTKIRDKELEMEQNWDKIKEQIKHSTIGRFPWKAVLGSTLANVIQTYNLKGFDSEEAYYKITDGAKFKEMIRQLPIIEQNKLKDKVKISVVARFGEKNSSGKLKERINNDK